MNIFFRLLQAGASTLAIIRREPPAPEVILPHHEESTSEGGEFLDDAIHMEEVPSTVEA